MRSTRTRPTLAALVCVASAGGLHELSRQTGGGWLAVFAGLLLALPLVSYALRPRLGDVTADRLVHGQPAVGADTETTLRIHNAGLRHLGRFVVEDGLRGHAPVEVAFRGLAPGGVVEVSVPRQALARGVGAAGPLCLVAPGPFGCLQVRRELEIKAMLTVHPQVLAVPGARSHARPAANGQAGDGTDVLGLRDWRPGEALGSISARATARHGRPVVLAREREEPPGLYVLVTAGEGATWERALSQAAGLLLEAWRSGTRPVLLGLGEQTARTGPSMLDLLAAADRAAPYSTGLLDEARRRAGTGLLALVVAAPPTDLVRGSCLVVLGD